MHCWNGFGGLYLFFFKNTKNFIPTFFLLWITHRGRPSGKGQSPVERPHSTPSSIPNHIPTANIVTFATKIGLSGCFAVCWWMVLVAKEPSLCNQNWTKRLFYSALMDGSNHKPKEPSLCNQIWVNWLFGSVLVGDFLGGDETKASDWWSGAFATVKKIVFYCFF